MAFLALRVNYLDEANRASIFFRDQLLPPIWEATELYFPRPIVVRV